MKKIIGAVLSAVLAFSSIQPAILAKNTDDYATRGEVVEMLLNAADNYNPSVQKDDIIHGDGSGLNEDRSVTRAEALVMLSRAFGDLPEAVGENKRLGYAASNFTDIPDWAKAEIQQVFDSGIVAGTSDTTFSPNDNVTKRQMELFINRVYSLFGTNPKDDFYAAVNKSSLDSSDGSPYVDKGVMAQIQEKVDNDIEYIIDGIVNTKGSYKEDTREQKINDLYKLAVNTESRNEVGISPIQKSLEKIDAAKNMSELMNDALTTVYDETVIPLFIDFSTEYDYDTGHYGMKVIDIQQPIMDYDTYYGGNDKYKDAYLKYLKELLVIAGEDEADAEKNAAAVFELEKEMYKGFENADTSSVLTDEYTLTDVKFHTYDSINALYTDFDLKYYFDMTDTSSSNRIVIDNTALFGNSVRLWTDENVGAVKEYAKILLLSNLAFELDDRVSNAAADLYEAVYGDSSYHSAGEAAKETIKNVFSGYIDEFYAKKYCDSSARTYIEGLTKDIIEVYKEKIDGCAWLSDETKSKAKEKLDNIRINAVADYNEYQYKADDVIIVNAQKGGKYFDMLKSLRKAYAEGGYSSGKLDTTQWQIPSYTANAAYDAYSNSITIPGAILYGNIYSKTASVEENMAGIGFIIAHELAHAFTGISLEYDEDGNHSKWMSDDEYRGFKKIYDSVAELYDGSETAPGIRINGSNTAGENIADLNAIECITEAIAKETAEPDYEKMYTHFAKTWCEYNSRESLESSVENDNHSTGKIRVNTTLSNLDEFYDTFDIKEGDGMYVAPEDRVELW